MILRFSPLKKAPKHRCLSAVSLVWLYDPELFLGDWLLACGLVDLGPCRVQFLHSNHLILCILQSQMRIGVHGNTDIRMTHVELYYFRVPWQTNNIFIINTFPPEKTVPDYKKKVWSRKIRLNDNPAYSRILFAALLA